MDVTKLKAFANYSLSIAKMMISLFDTMENTVRKGENAGYQHFLLYIQCFPEPSSLGSFTLYHTILTFNDPQQRGLLKTLWEKEKMLVTSIFSFSNIEFNPSQNKYLFFDCM